MRHFSILFAMLSFCICFQANAQDDDMYFTKDRLKKVKKTRQEPKERQVQIIYEFDEDEDASSSRVTANAPASVSRDIDEYNRRTRSTPVSALDSIPADADLSLSETRSYQLSAQSLYDLGYTEGYQQGYSDADDDDFYFATRLARFHGGHYYDPWYWSHLPHIHNPWYWDPWYCDPWYRPYYYGGWYSVGWGIGHCGSYWNPYWPGYHSHFPYYHHHSLYPHWGHSTANTPRYSTQRNSDYGRSRIVSRTLRPGESARPGRGTSTVRANGRATNAETRFNERSSERSRRVTDRSSGVTNRTVTNAVRRDNQRTGTAAERSSSRVSERNSQRGTGTYFNSGSTTSRTSGTSGSFGGGSSRSGGSRSGGGRGR